LIRTDREKRMVKYFLCIANREAVRRLAHCGLGVGQVKTFVAHGEIRSVFEEMIREGRHSSVRAPQICAVLLDLLLLKIADANFTDARPSEPARENFVRCKALIDAQAERFASLQDVAAAASLDVSSICRLFRRFHGTSPYQYLLRRKMNLAAEFLVENGGLVKEAAMRVGFADPYHFSRCFKATHGVPPNELRRHR
jgi:AraC-like DNA-binding protein